MLRYPNPRTAAFALFSVVRSVIKSRSVLPSTRWSTLLSPRIACTSFHGEGRWTGSIRQIHSLYLERILADRSALFMVSFIEPPQADVIEEILKHCDLWESRSARAPPEVED